MPAQVASARVFRYKAALREYSEARRGQNPTSNGRLCC